MPVAAAGLCMCVLAAAGLSAALEPHPTVPAAALELRPANPDPTVAGEPHSTNGLQQAGAQAEQAREGGEASDEADSSFEEGGIPVDDATLVSNCVSCHTMNDENHMTRISYMRKTPEGWQQSVRRMVLLQDVEIDPVAAREIVKYLSNNHGLAPEEATPGAFEVERRLIDYKYEADEEVEFTCIQCHSMGRVITQRRSEHEWELLMATHRYYYPLVDFQAFRRSGPPRTEPGPDGRPPDNRHPMDKAVDHLSSVFPLQTPEWTSWSANMRPARLAGTWAMSGYEPGKGPVHGRVTLRADPPADDEFVTEAVYVYARTGREVRRQGRAIVYTGFQWRGRSYVDNDTEGLREVMSVDRDWREMEGRWYTGGYDEIGLDVSLRRVTNDPLVSGVFPVAVRQGSTDVAVSIYGANLPEAPAAADLDFGPGIEVTEVVSATAAAIRVRVNAAADASLGGRDLFVGGTSHRDALVVYDKVDAIQVTPRAGMARVGGVVFPKEFQQFEAIAHSNGVDGEAGTEDDLDLGAVDVAWSLEEYAAVFDDDDIEYVGSIDDGGLFVPAEDGPNPDRSGNRNNVGDVWVVAIFTPDAAMREAGGEEIRARAHLLVTVPLYNRWEPWATGGIERR